MDVLDLLDEDSWEEVLDRVDPMDLKQCSETCLAYRRILERSKGENAWMFGEVLPLLFNYLYSPREPQGCWCCCNTKLNWKPLWACRLVCRSWCRFIDYQLETHADPDEYAGERHPAAYYICNEAETAGFLETFGNHSGNPFVGRNVRFEQFQMPGGDSDNEDENEEKGYAEKLFEFLPRYGDQIWTAAIGESTSPRRLEFCKNIQSLLHYLPNLRTLRLICMYRDEDEEESIEGLEEYLAENPLPTHSHLERIDLDSIVKPMGQSLLEKYSGQVTQLKVRNAGILSEENIGKLTSLKDLQIEGVNVTNTLDFLRLLHSPLERLVVWVTFQEEAWLMDKFLQNMAHLPVKLLDLTFQGPSIGESGVESSDAPQNNSVKQFVVFCDAENGDTSFNFLRFFTNLEEVHLTVTRDLLYDNPCNPNSDSEEPLRVTQDLYKSNIWELVPSLKQFSYFNLFEERWKNRKFYYREVYEEMSRRTGDSEMEAPSENANI